PKLTRALEGLYYTNQVKKVPAHKVKKLYGDEMYFSVSRLENTQLVLLLILSNTGLKRKKGKYLVSSLLI
ncbi:ATP-dependent nuclease subunit B, partial [Thermoanaerobacter ethanolicus JW 200]